jgi:hypothetical protein
VIKRKRQPTVRVSDISKKRIYFRIELKKPAKGSMGGKPEVHCCNGEFKGQLGNGSYKITVLRGRMYWPFEKEIEAGSDDVILEVELQEVIDLKRMKLYSFDAHSHVSRNIELDTGKNDSPV